MLVKKNQEPICIFFSINIRFRNKIKKIECEVKGSSEIIGVI